MTMHHLSAEEIAAYLDGECTDMEYQAAQSHLDACADCRSIANDQQFIKTLMGSLAEPELPRSFVLPAEMDTTARPLSSPGSDSTAKPAASNLIRFEPITRFMSIAAVIALLVLGGAQMAGIGERTDSGNNQGIELSETNSDNSAFEDQEPAIARGEVREQGESAAANAGALTTNNARVDTQAQASDDGLTLIEITTIGVSLVALASVASWILIRYRSGESGQQS